MEQSKKNRTQSSDRAHVVLNFDIRQLDFTDFVDELLDSKFANCLVGIEVKRPNLGNKVTGLANLYLRKLSTDQNEEETVTDGGANDVEPAIVSDLDDGGGLDDK